MFLISPLFTTHQTLEMFPPFQTLFLLHQVTLDFPRWICYLHSAVYCHVFILYNRNTGEMHAGEE